MSKRRNPSEAPIDRGRPGDMPVLRGPTDVAPPSKKEIERMKNREFMRKHPHTSV